MGIQNKCCFRFGVYFLFIMLFAAGVTMCSVPFEQDMPVYYQVSNSYYGKYLYYYTQGFTNYNNFGVAMFMTLIGFCGMLITSCTFCGMGVCCNCCCCGKNKKCKANTGVVVQPAIQMYQVQPVQQVQQPPQFVMPTMPIAINV